MEIAGFEDVLNGFGLDPKAFQLAAFGKGNINASFGLFELNNPEPSFLLQKINTSVFKAPKKISWNWSLAYSQITSESPDYQMISFRKTLSGDDFHVDQRRDFWRLMPFVSDSKTLDTVSNPDEAYLTAYMFGEFASKLSTANVKKFEYIIPDFHNLSFREQQFHTALTRASALRKSISGQLLKQKELSEPLVKEFQLIAKKNLLPTRIFHHDAKIGNILFSCTTSKPLVIIDLDTLMPGTVLSDIGDMLRTLTSSASENEADISKIDFREKFVAAVLQGYQASFGDLLTPFERSKLYFAGLVLVYMQALRFLSDFLNEDTYYRIEYPEHNLVRAKNQFHLLGLMMERRSEIESKYLTIRS